MKKFYNIGASFIISDPNKILKSNKYLIIYLRKYFDKHIMFDIG